MHMQRAVCSVFLAFVAGSSGATPLELERPHFSDRSALEQYRKALYARYSRCSNAAQHRILSQDDAAHCGALYMELKLSFLDGVTMERYRTMPNKTKKVALEKGFAAYVAWRHRYLTQWVPID